MGLYTPSRDPSTAGPSSSEAEPKVPSNSLQKTTEQIESRAAQTYIHGLYSRNPIITADYTT
jgi:hypothetical protein